MPLSRRYRADRMFQKKLLDGMWDFDTMYGQTKSLDGNIFAQFFSNGTLFAEIYPMSRKADPGI